MISKQSFNFLALLAINLSCHSENSDSLGVISVWMFYCFFYLCAVFIVIFYYSKLTKRLKLNNTQALAYGLWNRKCEFTKDRALVKLFKIDLEDKSMESLDLSFSIHIEELLDRHRLEKNPDINALNRYIEKELS